MSCVWRAARLASNAAFFPSVAVFVAAISGESGSGLAFRSRLAFTMPVAAVAGGVVLVVVAAFDASVASFVLEKPFYVFAIVALFVALGYERLSRATRGFRPLQQSLADESGVADAHLRYVTGAARPEARGEFPSGAWQRGYVFANSELERI